MCFAYVTFEKTPYLFFSRSPNIVKASPSKLSYVYQCVGCDSFHLQPLGRVTQKVRQQSDEISRTGSLEIATRQSNGQDRADRYGGALEAQPAHVLVQTAERMNEDVVTSVCFWQVFVVLCAASF
jgi:hypothetical protein